MNIIEIERLEKSFDIGDSKVRILKGINLQIQKGDFVCIMGASGSGKTTLLQLLGGLDIPSVGSIRVDGTEISTLKEKELALFRRH
ncbi:MAG TPA: ABC transporter ATP-binding protein, partial [Bacillus sp. (in: Bacteria)]|nr:ABC transporter ATP-binding protein [Bacillus sp. (in: firmicutes)]